MTRRPYPTRGSQPWDEELKDYLDDTEADLTAATTAVANDLASLESGLQNTISDNSDVEANTASRHGHANKALIDAIAANNVVPSGGKWYQMLTRGITNPEWVDPNPLSSAIVAVLRPTEQVGQDGTITLTQSGALRVREYPGGGDAWFVEEGTTNYEPNPISASTIHAINGYTHISGSRITNAGLNHPTAGLIDTATRAMIVSTPTHNDIVGFGFGASAAAMGYSVAVGAVAAEQTYFRVSPKLIGRPISLLIGKFGGTAQYVEKTVIGTGDWQYADVGITVESEGGTVFECYIRPAASNPITGDASMVGEYIDFTATQLEQKAYATSLAIHTMGTGYSLGPNGESIRAAGSQSMSATYLAACLPYGAMYQRALMPDPLLPGIRRTFRSGSYTASGYLSFADSLEGNGRVDVNHGVSSSVLGTLAGIPKGESFSRLINFNGGTFEVFTNGVKVGAASMPPGATTTNQQLFIGGYSGTQMANTVTAAILLFNRPLTAAELAYLDSIPTPELTAYRLFCQPWQLPAAGAFPVFTATHKTASGSTSLRVAPGASADEIASLSAGTSLEDSGTRKNVSGTDYARVATKDFGIGWVPATQVTSL